MDDMREKLAELVHSQWAGWMRYLFKNAGVNTNGEVVIPVWAVDRWKRQTESSYFDLPEKEKDSDREEADKVIAILEPGLSRLRAERDELRARFSLDFEDIRKEAESEFSRWENAPRSYSDICPKYGIGDRALKACGFIDGYITAFDIARAALSRTEGGEVGG